MLFRIFNFCFFISLLSACTFNKFLGNKPCQINDNLEYLKTDELLLSILRVEQNSGIKLPEPNPKYNFFSLNKKRDDNIKNYVGKLVNICPPKLSKHTSEQIHLKNIEIFEE